MLALIRRHVHAFCAQRIDGRGVPRQARTKGSGLHDTVLRHFSHVVMIVVVLHPHIYKRIGRIVLECVAVLQ